MSGVATRLATGASSGAIALRNSAQKSMAFSPSVTETAPRVRSLHRDLLRSVPWVKRAFGVSMPEAVNNARVHGSNARAARRVVWGASARTPLIFFRHALATCGSAEKRCLAPNASRLSWRSQKMRSLLTSAFKEKQNTTDVTTINRLIVQGRMELEEALMLWKGPSHVRPPAPPPPPPTRCVCPCLHVLLTGLTTGDQLV